MYIALGIMFTGILLGRILTALIKKEIQNYIKIPTILSILLLLFLLGVSIGGNPQLFASLPYLGLDAIIIIAFCLAGSIIVSWLLTRFI